MHATRYRRNRLPHFFAALCALFASVCGARADIFQWEYINPADPRHGKRQSATLTPGGAGVDALPGANLSNRNLTMAYLIGADLANAFAALTNLTNADLSQANLTHASFAGATLTEADFTGAEVRGAGFGIVDDGGTGITLAQLYSTGSYQSLDLSGISLINHPLSGGNFAGQNLTASHIGGANLTRARLRNANLTNATFAYYSFDSVYVRAHLFGADFTAADARGAFRFDYSDHSVANTANLIWPDGHMNGIDLDAGDLLVVRDYDGDGPHRWRPFSIAPIPVTVDQHFTMGAGGTLRMVFDADDWDSTISFAPDIPVTLDGTLELTFADDTNLVNHVGRTFHVFDWTGVELTGAFTVSSLYPWDVSQLYTTGEVTLLLPGDTNGDQIVSITDLNNVRNSFGGSGLGDTNGDGHVDLIDLNNVRSYFGPTVPRAVAEPANISLAVVALVTLVARRQLRPHKS